MVALTLIALGIVILIAVGKKDSKLESYGEQIDIGSEENNLVFKTPADFLKYYCNFGNCETLPNSNLPVLIKFLVPNTENPHEPGRTYLAEVPTRNGTKVSMIVRPQDDREIYAPGDLVMTYVNEKVGLLVCLGRIEPEISASGSFVRAGESPRGGYYSKQSDEVKTLRRTLQSRCLETVHGATQKLMSLIGETSLHS